MKRVLVCIIGVLLGSCDQQKPKFSEADMREIRAAYPGMTDTCLRKLRWGGIEAMPVATDQCFRMAPAERWRGLWARDFELSRFCPAPARECSDHSPGQQIWLSFSSELSGAEQLPDGGVYALDFIGRKTADRGHFGHLSMYEHEMVVDRMTSMKQIEAQSME